MTCTYAQYVTHRASGNPGIRQLEELLNQSPTNHQWRTPSYTSIEYPSTGNSGGQLTQTNDIDTNIAGIIRDSQSNQNVRRTIMIIEDISPQFIEKLGSAFDIDPLFFTGYLFTNFSNVELHPPPLYVSSLQSSVASLEFVHLPYQRIVKLGRASNIPSGSQIQTTGNVKRGVGNLAPWNDIQISIVKGCCAILRKKFASGAWLCLILVDSTSGNISIRPKGKTPTKITGTVPQIPLFDAKCNFVEVQESFSTFSASLNSPPLTLNESLLKNLELRYKAGIPHFNPSQPAMASLCYHPVRAVLAEWVTYSIAMSRSVKHYEYSLQSLQQTLHEEDIRELQVWRRRACQTTLKLRLKQCFLEYWIDKEPGHVLGPELVKDIQLILLVISDHARALELMLPVATSMVQLLDTRSALIEATNMRQLTYLALVFIPLSYVSGLFSMSDKWAPGSKGFWIYFTVAIPMLVFVFGISWSSAFILNRLRKRKGKTTTV